MKSLKIYLIAGGLLLIVYIIAQLNRPKDVDWTETLSSKDKIPFGTYILNNRLKDIFPASKIVAYRHPVYSVIAEDSVKASTYIIICPGIDITKADYEQLTKYLKQGNDVLIASEYFGKEFEKSLNIKTETYYKFGWQGVDTRFLDPHLNPAKVYRIDKEAGNCFFNQFDTLKAEVIGENSYHKANFIKYNVGKGSLYLVTNPKLFSNYSLLKSDGARYAATALSFLKPTNKIVVDEYYTQDSGESDSPMRLFLSNAALRWAYYIAVFSLIVFVLFEMKRRQRIIPIIEPLTNSTLDFVNVVGQVYYEKRNNANIAHKKILYFLTTLRDDFQIKANKFDSDFFDILTAKFNLEPDFANDLVSYLQYISVQNNITDRELIELNKLIEQFYIKSR